MIKILKANKSQTATKAKFKYCHKLIIAVLLVVCIIFISNPALYSKSCLNAISVWSFKVLPVLLPFFIFTKIIVEDYGYSYYNKCSTAGKEDPMARGATNYNGGYRIYG